MTLSNRTRNVLTRTPPPRLSTLGHIQIASLWFALFTQWMTVVPVLVPAQVAEMLGRDAALKEGVAGSVIASGAHSSAPRADCCRFDEYGMQYNADGLHLVCQIFKNV